MDNESIFFNPGDAIANSRDFREARRSAEVIKKERPTEKQIIIAEEDGTEIYAVYYADDATSPNFGTPHHIKDSFWFWSLAIFLAAEAAFFCSSASLTRVLIMPSHTR